MDVKKKKDKLMFGDIWAEAVEQAGPYVFVPCKKP